MQEGLLRERADQHAALARHASIALAVGIDVFPHAVTFHIKRKQGGVYVADCKFCFERFRQ